MRLQKFNEKRLFWLVQPRLFCYLLFSFHPFGDPDDCGTFGDPMPMYAPLAQLDRASDYGSEGCRFESCEARHSYCGVEQPGSSSGS